MQTDVTSNFIDVNIDGQDQTKRLSGVTDICYVQNMSNKTIKEADQYVAFAGETDDCINVLSLRKRSDLTIELFTIEIS